MHWSSLSYIATLSLPSLVLGAPGSFFFTSFPDQCRGYSYGPLKTPEGYDPCMLASAMIAVCSTGNYTLPGIESTLGLSEPGTTYTVPSDEDLQACYCNVPMYNALGACADCQYGDIPPWGTFTENCTEVQTDYPREADLLRLARNITLPGWTKIDNRQRGFDITSATEEGASETAAIAASLAGVPGQTGMVTVTETVGSNPGWTSSAGSLESILPHATVISIITLGITTGALFFVL